MVHFHRIDDYWQELSWFNTGGTRAKKYVQSPDGKYYYFKRSQFKPPTDNKPGKDFKYEFWSEIIAYEIGSFLGFNVLQYDIAYDGQNIGCISESMINSEKEQLVEGIKFLQAYNPEYQPENKAHQTMYNFQAIEGALEKFLFHRFKQNIVEVILFDAIIGNGDRHQENWAIILDFTAVTKAIVKLKPYIDKSSAEIPIDEIYDKELIRFAPIYDSGSSLGRELTDQRVNELLTSNEALNRYISKGLAEIHWNNKKVSHFDLIQSLLGSSHRVTVINTMERVVSKFDGSAIEDSINRIDIWLPEFVQQHKIPYPRKKLISKIISFRFERLKELINA